MGIGAWYERRILPHLIHYACGTDSVMKQRALLIPQARGQVLEVGLGTGHNLPFYQPDRVERIYAVDPALAMHTLAEKQARQIRIPVDMIPLAMERIEAASARFDTVVCTFTLCSIVDVENALQEMRRVLRRDGHLLFCEHGLAPTDAVRRWQRRLNPVWKPLAGGCHLDRNIPQLLARAGFRIEQMHTGYVRGPRPMTWVYRGQAVPV